MEGWRDRRDGGMDRIRRKQRSRAYRACRATLATRAVKEKERREKGWIRIGGIEKEKKKDP